MGIGCERGTYQGITREWMYWYDESGKRYFTPEERITESEERRQEAEKKVQLMAEKLKSMGIDPDNLR